MTNSRFHVCFTLTLFFQMSRYIYFIEALPEKIRQEALALCSNPPKAKVNQTVAVGQELPYYGGIPVIHTPGHTEGHISLYLQQSKVLIAADAMLCIDGKLHGPVPQTSLDLRKAQRS